MGYEITSPRRLMMLVLEVFCSGLIKFSADTWDIQNE